MVQKRAIAFDIGDKRIGVAISDPFNEYAMPCETYFRTRNFQADVQALAQIAKERGVGVIVCGMPVNYDGTESVQTVKTQAFIDALKNLILASTPPRPIDESRICFKLADEAAVYEAEGVRVSFIKTLHMSEPHRSYAVLFESDGKKVLFSGDLSHLLQGNDVPRVLFDQEIDAFVCEMAHFGTAELLPYLQRAKVKDVYITHVYPDGKYAEIKEMAKSLTVKIHTPDDKDSFEI